MVSDDDEAGGRGQKPRALIVTVYGLYAREAGGWMSIASVIKLLARCGVDAPSVRSAIFRLKRRGLLTAAKVDGAAGYALTDEAHQILREGDRRIFQRRRASHAHHLAFTDLKDQVSGWWDLPRLQKLYAEFLDQYGPVLTAYRHRASTDPAQAFVDHVNTLTDWRRLPYSDPGLPAEVLPQEWNGARAAETFFELHDRLAKPAHRFVESVLRDV